MMAIASELLLATPFLPYLGISKGEAASAPTRQKFGSSGACKQIIEGKETKAAPVGEDAFPDLSDQREVAMTANVRRFSGTTAAVDIEVFTPSVPGAANFSQLYAIVSVSIQPSSAMQQL
jgi:hypothetical protein